jgi:phosphoserine phosphatase SerB
MITAIISALNEERTIGSVIRYCRQYSFISEIIVVDDNSSDNSAAIARNAGAKVITSRKLGKGLSMEEGVAAATNEYLVFLDADIDPYPAATIPLLTQPLLNGEYDFVKSAFSRNAGRVTEILAKPLLAVFYPELLKFSQPLSGMIAGKKSYFERIEFFNDYGVDIGILIDMYQMEARIKEVNIGYIENKSKPWTALGKMSMEVAAAITTKAMHYRKEMVTSYTADTFNAITHTIGSLIPFGGHKRNKIAVFDMDNTILKGQFIDSCASVYGFTEQLQEIRYTHKNAVACSRKIALLLQKFAVTDLIKVAESIPIVEDIIDVVKELKQRGYKVGIISNSYDVIVNFIKTKIDADFAMANQLEHFEGRTTGQIKIPSYFYHNKDSLCRHSVCKTNGLLYACEEYNARLEECIAVGDSENDRCMIEYAGTGVSFCSKDEFLPVTADKTITASSFAELLNFAF